MKFLIIALTIACVQAVQGAAQYGGQDIPIIRSDFDISPDGAYKYSYETGNGIQAQAEGKLTSGSNSDYPAIETKGFYKYTSPEGEPVEITYVADENGYQPQGSHIPVPPPIPAYIQRSLEYIAAHPPPPARF